MFVSGVTFFRNVISLDYPFLESIRSLLPLVDEFIINIGIGTDGTREAIEALREPKIRIIDSEWDQALCKNGEIFSVQTNIGLSHVNEKADWVFYLQSDEVLHENDMEKIRFSMEKFKNNSNVSGLMFPYVQFIHDYWSIDPWAFRRAIRVIRPKGLRSVGDSSGFIQESDGRYLDKRNPDLWRYSGAKVYHYSSVKSNHAMIAKIKAQVQWYHGGSAPKDIQDVLGRTESGSEEFFPERFMIAKKFTGTHPMVMTSRVQSAGTPITRPNRWFNPRFYQYVLRHGFKG